MNLSVKNIEDKHSEHKKIIEKNDGAKFHDTIIAHEKEDPGYYDRQYRGALHLGKHNTEAFMGKVLNHNHPDHASALSAFKDKYNSDRDNVEKDMNQKAIDLTGAIRNPLKNTAYENKVLSMHTIVTPEDQGFKNKFTDYIRAKWDAVGYTNDLDFIKDFWDVHPMSRPQNVDINQLAPYHYHSGKKSTYVDN